MGWEYLTSSNANCPSIKGWVNVCASPDALSSVFAARKLSHMPSAGRALWHPPEIPSRPDRYWLM